jgi:hypothetical protein
VLHQVPNHDFTVFRGTCKNIIESWVPANGSDAVALVEIWLARLELGRFLGDSDVLNQNFSTAGHK